MDKQMSGRTEKKITPFCGFLGSGPKARRPGLGGRGSEARARRPGLRGRGLETGARRPGLGDWARRPGLGDQGSETGLGGRGSDAGAQRPGLRCRGPGLGAQRLEGHKERKGMEVQNIIRRTPSFPPTARLNLCPRTIRRFRKCVFHIFAWVVP